MLLQIKELYKDQCIIDEMPDYPNDYYWFKDEGNHLIGIKKNVSTSEKKLLSLLFDEIISVDFDQQTRLFWLELLLYGKTKLLEMMEPSYQEARFIFFHHNFDSESKIQFDQLIKSFNEKFIVLFIDREYGVILDFTKRDEYDIKEFEEIAKAINEDFYYNTNLYKTMEYKINETISEAFLKEFDLYKNYRNRHKLIMEQQELLLQYMILTVDDYGGFTQVAQKIETLAYDLIEVVKCYLENNFNLSMGAKALYMHRNTFMNKLEKFIQVTGLNVKEFKDATVAYLVIKNLELKHNV
ncbi:MAG: helix-turn-helix domain-containing protein [Turicibacter sp.]|nr:helix-turn-helix domain-containing protein [Turicibacter sp.]